MKNFNTILIESNLKNDIIKIMNAKGMEYDSMLLKIGGISQKNNFYKKEIMKIIKEFDDKKYLVL